MPCTARATGPRRAAILAASSKDPLHCHIDFMSDYADGFVQNGRQC